ncbi:MAG: arginine--tRNA ligase [Verrucomicrobia bacterium]|nr:arginine--tRNA ligase [Verrucomicrobiota bacterium]MCH8513136.1 arginine--tRNA ligase [Kiritimatiellia bacterium]
MKNTKTLGEELSLYVQAALHDAFPEMIPNDFEATVVKTADSRNGDYQCNDAMALSKILRKAPREIANAIVETLEKPDRKPEMVSSLEIAGPGFINFRLNSEWIADRLLAIEDDAFRGVPQVGAEKTVVIDYSSPNVAKPMHIGHIRSTVIGNALDRLHRFCGFRVLSDNHLGDWGTQFGLIILGYRHFVDQKALEASPVQELERVYVESYQKSKEDESWLDQARKELVKLQQGDEENLALWKKFVALSMGEFDKIYERLDVRFDLTRGESFYNEDLPGVLTRLDEAGLLVESDGAMVVDLEAEKLGVCIVRKTDGGFNYATTDLATVFSRVREFEPETILYVTDERQQRHFRQFFTVCEKLGEGVNLEHVWFGLMRLPEGTFSTRQGNVIKLEVLLDEAERRALEIVQSSSPDLPEAQQRDVARAVGIGALKYADLSQNPQSLVTFTWDKAMALDGNSAPYLQYAHARIRSVLDKHAAQFPDDTLEGAIPVCTLDLEKGLGLKVAQFPEAVLGATKHYRPNYLADYLYELAQQYSTYHQSVPFLKSEDGVRESRMRLIRMVADTLKTGLGLLGIEAPERI